MFSICCDMDVDLYDFCKSQRIFDQKPTEILLVFFIFEWSLKERFSLVGKR